MLVTTSETVVSQTGRMKSKMEVTSLPIRSYTAMMQYNYKQTPLCAKQCSAAGT